MACGVYQIRSTVDGVVYVGGAVNLQRRQRNHFRALRAERHHNTYLQRAFVKYGEHCFVFEVLEHTAKEVVVVREQYHIDLCLLLGPALYNHCLIAGSRDAEDLRGNTYAKGNILSAETRARMSAARQGNQNRKGTKHSDETRAKISASGKGKNVGKIRTPEMRARYVAAQHAYRCRQLLS